ncbi:MULTISPECIES: CdaR family transcriptional regulator [unclassified Nocardiopsis]|uniref:PucR family transcriptional regulator n=1 Tax=unclassified Nocardiopsis TaxID=2649073 RepID=UPI000A88B731|nr:PucR family transcriptional regulator [Nocardiopsis sp. TSRI0078]
MVALTLGKGEAHPHWRLDHAAEITSVYAAAYRREALVIPACGLLYVLLPAASGQAPTTWTGDLVSVLRENLGTPVQAAVAGVAPRMRAVPSLKKTASRALEVIADRPEQPVTTFEEVRSSVVLRELLDTLAEHPRLRDDRLDALDGEQRRSLSVYLDAFGDVSAAAERLHVHPNTLRHRIRRIRSLTGLDLDDADQRLLAALTLRSWPRAPPEDGARSGHDGGPGPVHGRGPGAGAGQGTAPTRSPYGHGVPARASPGDGIVRSDTAAPPMSSDPTTVARATPI